MKPKTIIPQIWFFLALVVFSIVMRFLPHLFNVTPILAVALLSGFHFRNKTAALLVPLSAMFLSDLVIGVHSLLIFVYMPILMVVGLGQWMRFRNPEKAWPVAESFGFAAFGSFLFFVISNLGVFCLSDMYPQNFFGLSSCFIAAIPFFERAFLGDLMFTAVVFSLYAFARQNFMKAELAHGR